VLAEGKILVEHVASVDLLDGPAPTQRPRQVVSRPKRNYCCRRVIILPTGNRLHEVHNAAEGAVAACDKEEEIGDFAEQLEL
jgi:hypothetical protein